MLSGSVVDLFSHQGLAHRWHTHLQGSAVQLLIHAQEDMALGSPASVL